MRADRGPIGTETFFRWTKAALTVFCLAPFFWLSYRLVAGKLGVSPVDTLTSVTGQWAIRLLIATISVTPLARVTGWKKLGAYRKPLGLFALCYASLHLLVYVGFDHLFRFRTILADLVGTPYLIVGLATFLSLAALGATSTKTWFERLGRRNWRMLHGLVYIAAGGAVVHYRLQVKFVQLDLLAYGVLTVVLLLYRLAYLPLRLRIRNRTTQ